MSRVLPALLGALLLAACSSSMDAGKIAAVHTGMTPDQVTSLLGRPARIEHAETTGLIGDVYHYPGLTGEGRVIFINQAVFKAEFVAEGKTT